MGTHIEAVWAQAGNGSRRATARGLANAAARHCFALAGHQPGDIDMLINVGMYREDSMGEPALAALIQQDIGATQSRRPAGRDGRGRGAPHAGLGGRGGRAGYDRPAEHAGTFSFDLLNGPCGAITAIQIESGFLNSGVIQLGAVVSSDVQPDVKDPGAAFLRPAGGALLLRWRDGHAGFTDFGTETFPEYQDLFTSGLVWHERHGIPVPHQGAGHNEMVVTIKPGFHARLADCAEEAARRFLRRLGLGTEDIDLLVPAPADPDFVDRLRGRLHVPGDKVAYTPEDLASAYTTGPIAALQAATKSGRLSEARTTLLLAAGPGATVALALYRQPDAEPK